MNTDTIFTSYQPIEQYFQLLETARGAKPTPPLSLKGIDAFLIQQLILDYPTAPTVIDLAGDATLGASTVLCASLGSGVQEVLAAALSGTPQAALDWRALLLDALDMLHMDRGRLSFVAPPFDEPETWAAIASQLNSLSPLIFLFSPGEDTPSAIAAQLDWLLNLHTDPMILLTRLGMTGEGVALEAALSVCRRDSPYRLTALREVCPFFGLSQLGVICRRNNTYVPIILERIRGLYDGNFNYLVLAETNLKLHLKSIETQTLPIEQVPTLIINSPTAQPPPEPEPPEPEEPPIEINFPPPALPEAPKSAAEPPPVQPASRGFLKRQPPAPPPPPEPEPPPPRRATYLQISLPRRMRAGESYEGQIKLRNEQSIPWLSQRESENDISPCYHWRLEDGALLIKEGIRSRLAAPVLPGETVTMPFNLVTPAQPGRYLLELDIVHEGVTWFSDASTLGPTFAIEIAP